MKRTLNSLSLVLSLSLTRSFIHSCIHSYINSFIHRSLSVITEFFTRLRYIRLHLFCTYVYSVYSCTYLGYAVCFPIVGVVQRDHFPSQQARKANATYCILHKLQSDARQVLLYDRHEQFILLRLNKSDHSVRYRTMPNT